MQLAKWKSHHWGAAALIIAGVFAVAFYWGQTSQVQASQPVSPYPVGTRVQANTSMNVWDKANSKAGTVQCVQQAGATGSVMDGPKNTQSETWLEIKWDQYCSGWSIISGPLTVL